MTDDFKNFFEKKYKLLPGISLGRPFFGEVLNNYSVNVSLKTLNRHGLITGSTGLENLEQFKFWSKNWQKYP